MCVDLSLGFLFCSIDLYLCLCASTMLSWWLWLCSRAWSQVGWFLQFHSSFSNSFGYLRFFVIPYKLPQDSYARKYKRKKNYKASAYWGFIFILKSQSVSSSHNIGSQHNQSNTMCLPSWKYIQQCGCFLKEDSCKRQGLQPKLELSQYKCFVYSAWKKGLVVKVWLLF